MKIAIIAGTSDATELIKNISEKHEITAFVATDYGKEILKNCNININIGRLSKQDFLKKLVNFDCIIDASHPFAEQVTEIVKSVCEELNINYLRLIREKINYNYNNIIIADSKQKACVILSKMTGNILFTTGVKSLNFYENHVKNFSDRAWVRILNTQESRKIAENSKANIIFSLPPFTEQALFSIIQKYNINILVSKDSGEKGGLIQKINIAKKCNIPVILIKRPEETGLQLQEILEYLN
ncbi:MAG: precorrin-6A reductase [Oscillospiraceae bacterium]|nr:precorrin-6A reductase [Oscillospiraceae bacterium]